MEQEGVIVRQTESTEWVNNLVTVIKPNRSVRLCLDPTDLNRVGKSRHVTREKNVKTYFRAVAEEWRYT